MVVPKNKNMKPTLFNHMKRNLPDYMKPTPSIPHPNIDSESWSYASVQRRLLKSGSLDGTEKYLVIDDPPYFQPDSQPVPSWQEILAALETENSFLQVIHESVRDFLLDESACNLYEGKDYDTFADETNFALYETCTRFLKCQELCCALPASRYRVHFPVAVPQLVKDGNAWMSHSFTQYARAYIWEHLRRSGIEFDRLPLPIEQKESIRTTAKRWWSLELYGKTRDVIEKMLSVLDRSDKTSKSLWLNQFSRLVGYGILSWEEAMQDRACAENFHEGFLTLISHGTKMSGRAAECAFVAASHHGQNQVIAEILLQGLSVDCVDLRRHTALLEAVRGNHTTTVHLLLKQRANTEISSP